jgi:hypothetical protein
VAIAFAADQTLVGASGFPGLPKALLWLGAIAAGGALALRAPRGPRRPDPPPVRPGTSGTTARARAATR